jgi:ribonuclease HI
MYEALIQGLWKAMDLNINCIEVFGDSQLVIKHVINSMFNTLYHLNNYQQEVWSLTHKFNSFDIKFIPHTDNFDTIMLVDEASNLNLDYDSIGMKFEVETSRPVISSIDWRNLNDD